MSIAQSFYCYSVVIDLQRNVCVILYVYCLACIYLHLTAHTCEQTLAISSVFFVALLCVFLFSLKLPLVALVFVLLAWLCLLFLLSLPSGGFALPLAGARCLSPEGFAL